MSARTALARELHEAPGPEATDLVLQILEHNRAEMEHTTSWLLEAAERRVAELEAENASLAEELFTVRQSILGLAGLARPRFAE